MEEEVINYDTRDEIMAFLKREREIHTIEECDNIGLTMFDRVRKVLDLRDLMKETRLNVDLHFNLSKNPQIIFSNKNSLFQNKFSHSQIIFPIFAK